jgi:hypothetical protein
MIEVELPDGTVVEFPPGTDPGVMKKAIQTQTTKLEAQKRVGEMSTLRKSVYGMERALDEPAMGLKQLMPEFLGGGLSEQDRRELAIRREMENQIPGSWAGRLVGDIAMGAGPAKVIQGQAAKVFSKALPKAAQYIGAAGAGAGIGAVQPTLEGESRAENAGAGAAFGLVGQAGGNLIGRAIEGVVPKSAAARALPQNVQDAATLGQVADRATPAGRVAAALEERLTSVPIIGSGVKAARERGMDTWRDEVLKKASPEGFTAPNTPGTPFRDRVGATYKEFKNRYTNALRGHTITPSQFFEQQVLRLTSDPKRGLPEDVTERIRKSVMNNYQSRFGATPPSAAPAGTGLAAPGSPGVAMKMNAPEAKDFESFLSDMSRQYKMGQAPMDSNIAKLYDDMERAWSTAYKRQLGPGFRKQMEPLDQKYAPYKTVERAAGMVGNEGGAFTPAQLTNSVAARTGKARFGRGEGMLADDARAGKSVFEDKLPNSGTSDRSMLLGGAAALTIDPISTLTTAGAIRAATPLFTSKAGKNAVTGDTKLQKLLQKMRANDAARQLGLPGGVMAQDLMVDESTRY